MRSPSVLTFLSLAAVLLGAGIGCQDRSIIASSAPGAGPPAATVSLDPNGDEFEDSEVVLHLAPGASIDSVNARYGTTTIVALPEAGIYRSKLPEGVGVDKMIADCSADVNVVACEPNFRLQGPEARQSSLAFDDGFDDVNRMHDQHALEQIRAWIGAQSGGGQGVLVAVLDTGIERTHPFFAGRIEGDGYDFVDGDAVPRDEPNGLDDDGDGLVDEALGHGTHVSGLVAAVAPRCRILPLRVLDSDGVGTTFGVAQAIRYAAERGATVINLSLGTLGEVEAIVNAASYAQTRGAVCVAAAGNDGKFDRLHYPAKKGLCISVLSVDANDVKAPFSNYAAQVSTAAPGVGVYSTYWDGGFATWSGTSMSTALVSGAVAVLRGMHPQLSAEDVREAVRQRGRDITAANRSIRERIGNGRLDLGLLLRVEPREPPPAELPPQRRTDPIEPR